MIPQLPPSKSHNWTDILAVPTPRRNASFIELVARDAPEHDDAIELMLPRERRVRVGASFDAATLTRLVRALEAC